MYAWRATTRRGGTVYRIALFESGVKWTGGGATWGFQVTRIWIDEDGHEIIDLIASSSRLDGRDVALKKAKRAIKSHEGDPKWAKNKSPARMTRRSTA